jgi:hypothetical protein
MEGGIPLPNALHVLRRRRRYEAMAAVPQNSQNPDENAPYGGGNLFSLLCKFLK